MIEKIEKLLHQYPNIQESKTPFYDKSELDESESLNDAEDLSLTYEINASGLDLITYSDASFATPPYLVCTSGMCIYAGEKLVHWKSSKQKLISKSTFTAELYSCISAVEYTVYVKKFLEFFISRINKPVLCIDNVPLYKSLQKDFGYTIVPTDLMKTDPLTKVSNKLKSLFAGEVL
uniref:DDE_3 domain-containing protein n=1 Tax=Strongyloides venezuelensis TaxID=75913 RepID=A0A0K0FTB3_STRVS